MFAAMGRRGSVGLTCVLPAIAAAAASIGEQLTGMSGLLQVCLVTLQ